MLADVGPALWSPEYMYSAACVLGSFLGPCFVQVEPVVYSGSDAAVGGLCCFLELCLVDLGHVLGPRLGFVVGGLC